MQCNYNCDKGYRMLKVMFPPDLVSKVKEVLLTICKRQNWGGKQNTSVVASAVSGQQSFPHERTFRG